MGEEGCERFTWAFESIRDAAPSEPSSSPRARHHDESLLPTSSTMQHRTPSIEFSPETSHTPRHIAAARTHEASTTRHCTRTPSVELSPEPSHTQRHTTRHRTRTPSVELSPEPSHTQHQPTARVAASHPSSSPSHCRVWPFDFYAHEMDTGFKLCCDESNRKRPVEKVFRDHFHTKFAKSTFYDHRRHWMSISSSVRERYIGYGNTKHG